MSRGWAVVVLALLLAGAYMAMWRGWRRRGARQVDFPHLPGPLPSAELLAGPVEAAYVGTTTAGDWLDRVVVQTLGRRSRAAVTVTRAGITIERAPEPTLHIPSPALRGVRTDRAGALRATRSEQLLVITWSLTDRGLETVLRPRRRSELDPLHATITSLISDEAAA